MRRALACAAFMLSAVSAIAADETLFDWHAQTTYARQFKPAIQSPYQGANSLRGAAETSYTFTGTLFLGLHLPNGTELYFNPETVRANPFSGLHGLGGFVIHGEQKDRRLHHARGLVIERPEQLGEIAGAGGELFQPAGNLKWRLRFYLAPD